MAGNAFLIFTIIAIAAGAGGYFLWYKPKKEGEKRQLEMVQMDPESEKEGTLANQIKNAIYPEGYPDEASSNRARAFHGGGGRPLDRNLLSPGLGWAKGRYKTKVNDRFSKLNKSRN